MIRLCLADTSKDNLENKDTKKDNKDNKGTSKDNKKYESTTEYHETHIYFLESLHNNN